MIEKSPEELKKQIYFYEEALEDIFRISKIHSGEELKIRINNLISERLPDLAKKLGIK